MKHLPCLSALLPVFAVLPGCRQPEMNPTPTTAEDQTLTEQRQLTRNFKKAGEAYFSPDMKWIIFQASAKNVDDDTLMYLAQLKWDGDQVVGLNTPIPISPDPSWNSCGFFSPDGNSLIFSSTALHPKPREEGGGYQRDKHSYRWAMPTTAEIFRADGWKGAIAALPPGQGTNLAKYPLTHDDAHQAECSYSPDGKWIIYTSFVDDLALTPPPQPRGEMLHGTTAPAAAAVAPPADTEPAKPLPNYEIFVMRPDGSHKTRLTRVAGYDGGPFFSPDGKRICYRSDRVGENFLQIYVADLTFDAAGDITGIANERQLTHDPRTVNWGPYWHPDGHHLIYATSIHGHANYELYMTRDDGSHKTRITFAPGADLLPVFSPDGKWLMWTSQRAQEQVPDARNPGKTKSATEIWIAKFKMPPGA
jgi:Tol biopolymer transport system component